MSNASQASDPEPRPKNQQKYRILAIWMFGLIGLTFLSVFLSWFDSSTELIPTHNTAALVCLFLGGIMAVLSGAVGIAYSRGLALFRRIGIAISCLILGFLSAFTLANSTSTLLENQIDFPPSTTKTYLGLIRISRAYQTHGKGRGWDIQTMPLWADLNITQHDYEYMLRHRRPGDQTTNPDRISSNGYFCARVTVQQSGRALRILHAGSHKLPEDSVMICPTTSNP